MDLGPFAGHQSSERREEDVVCCGIKSACAHKSAISTERQQPGARINNALTNQSRLQAARRCLFAHLIRNCIAKQIGWKQSVLIKAIVAAAESVVPLNYSTVFQMEISSSACHLPFAPQTNSNTKFRVLAIYVCIRPILVRGMRWGTVSTFGFHNDECETNLVHMKKFGRPT